MPPTPSLVVVRPHPLCAETPAPQLRHAVTPRESVYVRSNFPTPLLGPSHVLTVGGAVKQSFAVSMAELSAMPQQELLVTMECAGNWRLAMDPVPEGEPWRYGAVSTTRWRGVPLRVLLEQAGVKPEAVELLAIGADHGPRDDVAGEVTFARSLPLGVAMAGDVLVATHMDGVPITAAHGAPVRLVVPGWYGMASVKWLVSLELITAPYTGYFQVRRYVYERAGGVEPVREALVKSMITSPVEGESVRADADGLLTVRGWAWSGAGPVVRVEVGVNGVWHEAQVGRAESRWAWAPFEARVACAPGDVVLSSRATDATGAVQPERIGWNRLGYGNHAVRPISIAVLP